MRKIPRELLSSIMSIVSRDAIVSFGQIALTPLFLIRFGQDDYNNWLIVMSYTSFIVLADFGLSTVIISRLIFTVENFRTFDFSLWTWFRQKTLLIALVIAIITAFFYLQKISFQLLEQNFFSSNMQLFIALAASSFVTLFQHFWLYKLQVIGKAALAQRNLTVVRSVEVVILALLLQMDLSISNFAWIFVPLFLCLKRL